ITAHSFKIVNQNIEQIKNQLASVITSFEEIRATSESTSKNASVINTGMNQVLQKNALVGDSISKREIEINEAKANAERIHSLFQRLTEKSASIQNATEEINDVSDRTNVLAINASIEAARAGAVGRGFRIIANEVKTLASQTGTFAKDISNVIQEFSQILTEIEQQISEFIDLLNRLNQDFSWLKSTFAETAKNAQETSSSIAQITGAIQEQTFALNEGLKNLETTFRYLTDSHAVLHALVTSHEYLDKLLDRKS
ncbi:MAG: methyl-accepting chemotaxis protein, partial [Spirochaetales bacterium]|nr:methyl-accepting chemotaxis protein [Spirochaetales bacterium]